jgi:hypothetical protein
VPPLLLSSGQYQNRPVNCHGGRSACFHISFCWFGWDGEGAGSRLPRLSTGAHMIEMGILRQGIEPVSPKEMEIVTIPARLASELNACWHSRLPVIHWSNIVRNRNYICYGATFDWKFYACAIWSSPVNQHFDFDTVMELRRFAISPDAPRNTATWMLGKMIKKLRRDLPTVDRLISYQDTEVHTGTIYKAGNWQATEETQFRPWDASRQRNSAQSTAAKIRWEYRLNPASA